MKELLFRLSFCFLFTLSLQAQVIEQKAVIAANVSVPGGNYGLSFLLDAAAKRHAVAFQVPQAITLAKVNFKTTSVTGAPTAEVRIETNSSGRPSGTLAWTNANKTGVVITSGWQTEITLTATGSLAIGTMYHLVILNDHATPASNSFAVMDQNGIGVDLTNVFDLLMKTWTASSTNSGAAWANRSGPLFMLASTDATPILVGQPADTTSLQTMHVTTGYGVKFTASLGGNVSGVMFSHVPNTGAATVTAKLYNSSDTLLGTATLAGPGATVIARQVSTFYFDSGPVAITSGSVYRIVFLDSGSADRIDFITTPSSPDYRTVLPFLQNAQWTQGTTGAWTDTPGKYPAMFAVLMSSITAGGGTTVVPSVIGY